MSNSTNNTNTLPSEADFFRLLLAPVLDIQQLPAPDRTCAICRLPYGEADPIPVPSGSQEAQDGEDASGEQDGASIHILRNLPFHIPDPTPHQVTIPQETPFLSTAGESVAVHCPVRLPCGHVFGHECIALVLAASSNLCPLCRRPLFARLLVNEDLVAAYVHAMAPAAASRGESCRLLLMGQYEHASPLYMTNMDYLIGYVPWVLHEVAARLLKLPPPSLASGEAARTQIWVARASDMEDRGPGAAFDFRSTLLWTPTRLETTTGLCQAVYERTVEYLEACPRAVMYAWDLRDDLVAMLDRHVKSGVIPRPSCELERHLLRGFVQVLVGRLYNATIDVPVNDYLDEPTAAERSVICDRLDVILNLNGDFYGTDPWSLTRRWFDVAAHVDLLFIGDMG